VLPLTTTSSRSSPTPLHAGLPSPASLDPCFSLPAPTSPVDLLPAFIHQCDSPPSRFYAGYRAHSSLSKPRTRIRTRIRARQHMDSSTWDLTSCVRKTKGEVPPPLVSARRDWVLGAAERNEKRPQIAVGDGGERAAHDHASSIRDGLQVGASVTLVRDSVYVFGGRPVASSEIVASLYQLDLRSLVWERLSPACASDDPSPSSGVDAKPPLLSPAPRYFHSAAAWGDKIVFFGGQGFVPGANEHEEGHIETLDDLIVWDTLTHQWSFPSLHTRDGVSPPPPRYAHLAIVTSTTSEPTPGFGDDDPTVSSRLTIVGGQDGQNEYLSEMHVLDLDRMAWIAEAKYPRRAGTYRSVGVAASSTVEPGQKGEAGGAEELQELVRSSYSTVPTEERPEPILVFSNTNIVSLVFSPLPACFDRPLTCSSSLAQPSARS
jgi:hypothetical protein